MCVCFSIHSILFSFFVLILFVSFFFDANHRWSLEVEEGRQRWVYLDDAKITVASSSDPFYRYHRTLVPVCTHMVQ